MPQKPQHVSGWFAADDPSGAHPEHPIYNPVDPDYGKPIPPEMIWGGKPMPHPEHPIVLPPLPPLFPPPGQPAHPIVLPDPPVGSGPVYIQGTPDKPITSAPGTLTPDLPSGSVPMGTCALLVKVPGVEGERWLTYTTQAQPKP